MMLGLCFTELLLRERMRKMWRRGHCDPMMMIIIIIIIKIIIIIIIKFLYWSTFQLWSSN